MFVHLPFGGHAWPPCKGENRSHSPWPRGRKGLPTASQVFRDTARLYRGALAAMDSGAPLHQSHVFQGLRQLDPSPPWSPDIPQRRARGAGGQAEASRKRGGTPPSPFLCQAVAPAGSGKEAEPHSQKPSRPRKGTRTSRHLATLAGLGHGYMATPRTAST